jgi:hypothetical protein
MLVVFPIERPKKSAETNTKLSHPPRQHVIFVVASDKKRERVMFQEANDIKHKKLALSLTF